eukprot:13461455-Heterocapsa_arctica.AAC.1
MELTDHLSRHALSVVLKERLNTSESRHEIEKNEIKNWNSSSQKMVAHLTENVKLLERHVEEQERSLI